MIKLAREINATSLLPAAFYDLSRYHFSQLFDFSGNCSISSTASGLTLSLLDTQCLALGKESSQQAVASLVRAMGTVGCGSQPDTSTLHCRELSHRRGYSCMSPAACQKDISELMDTATQHYLFDRGHGCADPLYVAEELGQLKSAEFSDCKACGKTLERWAAREREKLWKLIPGWFKLS